jgi:hypothetical protein
MRAGNRTLRAGTLVAALAVLVSCNEPSSTSPEDDEIVQGILFHGAYTNWAWTPVNVGLYVDKEGNVWRMRASIPWNLDAPFEGRRDTTSYPAAELEAMYEELGDSLVAVVDSTELAEKFALIRGAAEGSFSEGEKPGADQGTLVLGCLLYDPRTATYRRVVLSVTGDWRVHNLSPEAQALTSWLLPVWTQAR